MNYTTGGWATITDKAIAQLREYANGSKVLYAQSPADIARYGREPLDADVAAQKIYDNAMATAAAHEQYPTVLLHRHRAARRGRRGMRTRTI